MSTFHVLHPAFLTWLALVPLLGLFFLYAARKRRASVQAFGAEKPVGRKREAFGICAAVALVVVALSRPVWGVREEALQEKGRDLVFLLDVSRSMLADDMFPNRLENSKMAILDAVDSLIGDRLGLVLFAGSAEVRCPLTTDYAYFRMAVRQASPESISLGGTDLANALEKVQAKLVDSRAAHRLDVILISDGDDLSQSGKEIQAARELGKAGVRLICIGVGDPVRGSRVVLEARTNAPPVYLLHDGKEVWTRLHSRVLRQMAAATPGGAYLEVGTAPFDLKRILFEGLPASTTAGGEGEGRKSVQRFRERFPLFLGAALIVLFFTTHPRRKR